MGKNLQRNRIISFMQCVGIICVVVGHSFAGQVYHPVRLWLTSFEMPLFMAISGFLAAWTLQRKGLRISELKLWGSKGYLTRKVRRLLLPYAVLSIATFPLKALLSRWALRPIDFTFKAFLHQFFVPTDNVISLLWFLPALFLIFVCWCYGARLLVKLRRPINPLWILLPTALLTGFDPLEGVRIFCIGRAAQYLFFFALGWYCTSIPARMEQRSDAGWILVGTFAISLLWMLVPWSFWRLIATAINGIVMCMAAAAVYVRRDWRWLDWMDGSTFAIYLLSWFPQVFCQQFMGSMLHLPWQLCTVAAAITGVMVPWLIWRYVLRPLKIKL